MAAFVQTFSSWLSKNCDKNPALLVDFDLKFCACADSKSLDNQPENLCTSNSVLGVMIWTVLDVQQFNQPLRVDYKAPIHE